MKTTWIVGLGLAALGFACDLSTPDADEDDAAVGPRTDASIDSAVSPLASCSGSASSLGSPTEVRSVQAVGDSILGWNKETSESIPDFVGVQLGVSVQNNATGGATFGGEDGIASLYESGDFSHVLVNGGGNDFAGECTEEVLDGIVSPDLSSGIMVGLLDAIAADGAQSVLVGYYLPRDEETGCELFPELLRRYRALAETRSDVVYVCTLETITPATPRFYADDVHPSPAGSAAIGRVIAETLQDR